jgi:hypothetical protein
MVMMSIMFLIGTIDVDVGGRRVIRATFPPTIQKSQGALSVVALEL